eukprot:TRINITY_DN9522_c0_g1_i1.p1 TRINITY_DN9522_c0_g1~~TRINITY_DN9522_c0_g1_i1.p1  ORF type:complete len:371 (+),score=44.53 TRINITY_DN9522_c0_g1_i1:107-1219(+)
MSTLRIFIFAILCYTGVSDATDLSAVQRLPSLSGKNAARNLELSVLSLAQVATKDNNSDLSNFTSQILALVNNTMKPNIQARRKQEQEALNQTYQLYFNCSMAESYSETTMQNLATDHDDCRNNESDTEALFNACIASLTPLFTNMTTECGIFSDLDEIPEDLGTFCGTKDVQASTHLDMMITAFDNRLTAFREAKQNCSDAKEIHDDQVTNCSNINDTLNDYRAWCKANQTAVENFACGEANGTHCTVYDTCWGNANTSYYLKMGYMKAQEEELKAEWRSLQRIECYIGAFSAADKKVAIDTCKGNTYTGWEVNLTYYDEPTKNNCSTDMAWRPGTSEFASRWFSNAANYSSTCQAGSACCENPTYVVV